MFVSCKILGILAVLLTISIHNFILKNYNNGIKVNQGSLNITTPIPDVRYEVKTKNNETLNNKNQTRYEIINSTLDAKTDTSKDECGIRDHGPEKNFIVNGAEVDPLDWPWLAVLYRITNQGIAYNCVGSLVSRNKVVTAAHCVINSVPEHIFVILSRFNTRLWGPNDESVTKEVLKIAIHPSYYGVKSEAADLAVLTLKYNTQYNYKIRPVCILAGHQPYGQHGTVVGWGRNENNEVVTLEPRKVELTIVKSDECISYNQQFNYIINDYKFCAANDTEGIGPCQGDSGGGFYVKRKTSENKEIWSLRGVVSGSLKLQDKDDCLDQKYFTFTDIEKQIGWIRDQIEVNNETLPTKDITEEERQNIAANCLNEITNSKENYVRETNLYKSRVYYTENVVQILEKSKEFQARKFQEIFNSTSDLGHILKILIKIKQLNTSIPIRTIAKFADIIEKQNTKNNLIDIISAEAKYGKAALLSTGRSAYSIEAIKYLIKSGADPLYIDSKVGRNAIQNAVIHEQFNTMKYLLENYNYDINLIDKNGWTALGLAAHSGNMKILKYLVEVSKAKCNGYRSLEGYTPLQWVAYSGKLEIVKYLVENCDADVNAKSENGKTALDLAVSEGFNDIIFYLYYKTSGNHSDIFDTPLHQAVFFNDIPAIRKLLANKFDINARDRRNQTALIWASKTDDLNLFKYLAEVGKANIFLSDEHGYTVAHWAAFSGQLNILKYLVDKFKIDLNVLDNTHSTPLHWAAGSGHLNVVKYLVRERKVDTSIRNFQGSRAVDVASANYKANVWEWMKKYQAKIEAENST